jgi:hypothetical protein
MKINLDLHFASKPFIVAILQGFCIHLEAMEKVKGKTHDAFH